MKKSLLILLILALLIPAGLSQAQEPGTKEDNACYAGGSMAGKCDTEWEWVCGYYLARWEAAGGWNTPNNRINDACVSLLPPRPLAANAGLPPLCRLNFVDLFCLLGDGTVTFDANNDGSIDQIGVHTTGDATTCALTFGGIPFSTHNSVAGSTLPALFTPSELAQYGFTANICIYG